FSRVRRAKKIAMWRNRLLLTATLTAVACFAEGGAEVTGHIRDATGQPLEGVRLVIEAPSGTSAAPDGKTVAETVSRSDGCFDAAGTHVSGRLDLQVRASKDGFKPYVAQFRSGFYTNDITLAPLSSP